MSATMQAAVLEATGAATKLPWQTVPKPEATPGHLVVKVNACAVAQQGEVKMLYPARP